MEDSASDYLWHRRFRDLWETAAQLYEGGQRNAERFFSKDDLEWLGRIGCSTQEIYDFAEDWCGDGEPDYDTALLVTAARRDYFLFVLKGESAAAPEPEKTLPKRKDELDGIPWLPRIIEKARRKLSGTLSDDVMYCCGGDRQFLSNHGIHPADFLRVVWANLDDEKGIVEYVRQAKRRLDAARTD